MLCRTARCSHSSTEDMNNVAASSFCGDPDGEKLRGLEVPETDELSEMLLIAGECWVYGGGLLMLDCHKLQNAA